MLLGFPRSLRPNMFVLDFLVSLPSWRLKGEFGGLENRGGIRIKTAVNISVANFYARSMNCCHSESDERSSCVDVGKRTDKATDFLSVFGVENYGVGDLRSKAVYVQGLMLLSKIDLHCRHWPAALTRLSLTQIYSSHASSAC